MIKRILLIVFDGFGIGSYEVCKDGDDINNSLVDVIRENNGINIPTLCRWGIGNLINIDKYKVSNYIGCVGKTRQQSKFCDSFAAHWEMAGKVVNEGIAFTNGIPDYLIEKFESKANCKVIGNLLCYEDIQKIDERILNEHILTRSPIVLTIPAEEPISTFALLGCESVIPHEELFELGRKAKIIFKDSHEIGRIVAKSFLYKEKKIELLSHRFDIANFIPPKPNLLDYILNSGRTTMATGKIGGLFNNYGFSDSIRKRA
ncbi:MAG: hypothetical protein KID00_02475 [Clostridium argentinense]|nr:hypothetical protein [Clostridium argentinense]